MPILRDMASSVLSHFTPETREVRRRMRARDNAIGLVCFLCFMPFVWIASWQSDRTDGAMREALQERGRFRREVRQARADGTLTLEGVLAMAERCQGTTYTGFVDCISVTGAVRRADGRYAWRGPATARACQADHVFEIHMARGKVAAVTSAGPATGTPGSC